MPFILGTGGGAIYDAGAAAREQARINNQISQNLTAHQLKQISDIGENIAAPIQKYGERRQKQADVAAERTYKTQERIAGDEADIYKQQVSYAQQGLNSLQTDYVKRVGELTQAGLTFHPKDQQKLDQLDQDQQDLDLQLQNREIRPYQHAQLSAQLLRKRNVYLPRIPRETPEKILQKLQIPQTEYEKENGIQRYLKRDAHGNPYVDTDPGPKKQQQDRDFERYSKRVELAYKVQKEDVERNIPWDETRQKIIDIQSFAEGKELTSAQQLPQPPKRRIVGALTPEVEMIAKREIADFASRLIPNENWKEGDNPATKTRRPTEAERREYNIQIRQALLEDEQAQEDARYQQKLEEYQQRAAEQTPGAILPVPDVPLMPTPIMPGDTGPLPGATGRWPAELGIGARRNRLGQPIQPAVPAEPPVTEEEVRKAQEGIRKIQKELADRQPKMWGDTQKFTDREQEKLDKWQATIDKAISQRRPPPMPANLPPEFRDQWALATPRQRQQIVNELNAADRMMGIQPAAPQQLAPQQPPAPLPPSGVQFPETVVPPGGVQQLTPSPQQKTPEEAAIDAEVSGILSRPHQPMPPMVRVPSSATPETMRQFAEANGIPQQAPAPPQKVMLPRDLKERASVVRQSAQSLDNSQIASAALKAKPEEARQVLASLKDALQERAKSLERGADADPMLLKRITTLGRMLIALTAVPSR